jgi:hypothetical protein
MLVSLDALLLEPDTSKREKRERHALAVSLRKLKPRFD